MRFYIRHCEIKSLRTIEGFLYEQFFSIDAPGCEYELTFWQRLNFVTGVCEYVHRYVGRRHLRINAV